jgi:tetratricopeptide (TPR) repeat protein
VLLALLGWRFRTRSSVRALLAGFVLYVVLISPVLGFLDIGFMMYSLVADHWQYGAMPALLALIAATLVNSSAGRALAIVVIVLLGAAAYERSEIFADESKLWADNVRKQPGVARGWYGRGVTRLDAADYEGARTDFEKTIHLDENFGAAYFNLGVYHLTTSNHVTAARYFREAMRCDPRNAAAQTLLKRCEKDAPGTTH